MTALAEQQRAATQRGYLLFFLFFFLLVTANDFTPAKTRRNARAGASRRGASEGAGNGASASGTRREEVRDKVRPRDGFRIAMRPRFARKRRRSRAERGQGWRARREDLNLVPRESARFTIAHRMIDVIIDLSESNVALEVENRRLRASAIGFREALVRRGGGDEAREIDEAYNLTSLVSLEGAAPQLRGRDDAGKPEGEANGVREVTQSSRRLLRERFVSP